MRHDRFMLMKNTWLIFIILVAVVAISACTPETENTAQDIRVELVDQDVRRTYIYNEAISIDEFLDRIQADLDDLDRVEPSRFTQIQDGMTITIVRVTEERTCYDSPFPYETRRIPTDALEPGVEEISQVGVNGTSQSCERCIIENGVQTSCSLISETIIEEPREQIIYVGTGGVDVPLVLEGKLAYISSGQAYFIEGNLRNRRPITTEGGLDGRVFDLSANGRQLLYTRFSESADDPDFTNGLWAILDTGTPQPVRLLPDNVIAGAWVPGQTYTLSYSTAEPREGFPGWEAYNDIYVMRIDNQTGETIDFNEIIGTNAIGIYSYWGTNYKWSPDGQKLAWSRADSVGLVQDGEFVTLATFPHFDPAIVANWVWQPEIEWSQDSQMLITTLHGDPFGSESPINSVVFDIAVLQPEKNFIVSKAIPTTGIWSQPRYSPIQQDGAGFPNYSIAYLQARDPLNSLGGEYDLVVSDRDGSNPEAIFPPDGRQGVRPFSETQPTEFVWSPSGTHIAIIYQGDLWIVEASTGLAQQITTDGQSSHPRWAS